MNIKKTVTLVVLLLAVLIVALFFLKEPAEFSGNEMNQQVRTDGQELTYTNPQNNQSLKVVYYEDGTAAIYPDDVNQVIFTATTSASGARYENADNNLVLLNMGNEISLSLNDSVIFVGVAMESLNVDGNPTDGNPAAGGSGASGSIQLNDRERLAADVWVWQETLMNDGTVTTPNQADAFTLTFKNDGTVSGTTDCNGFGGQFSLNGPEIQFGQMFQTLMFCEDSQEGEFNQRLAQVQSYMFDENDQLILLIAFDSGSMIFSKQ